METHAQFEIKGATFAYDQINVLKEITATIPAGATTAVLGASGAGKSTLLYLLGRLWDQPLRQGSITYCANQRKLDYSTCSLKESTQLCRREFGFVLQSSYLLPHLNCVQNVAMPLALQGWARSEREDKAFQLIAQAGEDLKKDAHRSPSQISGGQRQRVAVLRALIHGPRVLFADEPVSNLDPQSARKVEELLNVWKQQSLGTLILVSHDRDIAFRLSDHFLILQSSDHTLFENRLIPRTELKAVETLGGLLDAAASC